MPTMRNSVAVRDAKNNAFETAVGTSPKLRYYTGALPATVASARTGTMLCEIPLPSDWLSASSAGTISKLGTWSGTGAAAGVAGYYSIMDAAGTTCHEDGDVTATGGGGAMTLDNVNIAVSQVVTVTSYSKTAGNA